MRKTRKMTRCECQEVPFRRVLNFARERDVWALEELSPMVGCGQVCTACHCDLKAYLKENRPDGEWNGYLPSSECDLYDMPLLPEPDLALALSLGAV